VSEKLYFMARSLRDTAIQEGEFYTLSELVDETNQEIADFLVQGNIAIESTRTRETAPTQPAVVEQPVKRGRGRPRKDSYMTREMKAG